MGRNKTTLYESILESIGDGLIVINDSLEILLFNQRAEELTGLSRSYTAKTTLKDAFSANPWFSQIVERVLKEGYVVSDYERRLERTGRRPIHVGITASPLLSKDGKNIGVVITMKDLSGFKPLKEDSLRGERLAFLDTMAAGIAHEVRNPLGGIKGAIQLLSKRLKRESLLEYTRIVNKEVERIDRVLGRLLSFSNPKGCIFKPLNIHRLLDHVISLFSAKATDAGIAFIKTYDPSIPSIEGDEDSLIQVFLNIIKNSMEAIEGEGSIEIRTRVLPDLSLKSKEGQRKIVSIEIKDSGKGIQEKEISNVFTPFYTTKEQGTGLGLSLSLKIINDHSGFIDIDSVKGKGTTVSVFLPLPKKGE